MKTTTPTTRGRRTCAEIFDSLSDDSRTALERWRRLANLDCPYMGGRGHTREQMSVAVRAWDELPPAAQSAYFSVRVAVVFELLDALRAVGVPEPQETEKPINSTPKRYGANILRAVEALLGPDHPALRVLPADAIVDAFEEAIYQAGDKLAAIWRQAGGLDD